VQRQEAIIKPDRQPAPMRRSAAARGSRRARRDAGFTLLELLVVLGILTIIAAVAAPQVLAYLGQARSQTAEVQIRNIGTALELFYLHNGGYPSEEVGLAALVERPPDLPTWRGPYLRGDSGIVDPWGRPYLYRAPGQHGDFDVWTLGRNGQEGGTGEDRVITSW
jgi:general secretion pathway protein G